VGFCILDYAADTPRGQEFLRGGRDVLVHSLLGFRDLEFRVWSLEFRFNG